MILKSNDATKLLNNRITQNASDKKTIKMWVVELEKQFEVPSSFAFDILACKIPVNKLNEFELFIFMSIIEPQAIGKYFTQREIEKYSRSKFKYEKITFPLRYKAVKIAEDQWLCSLTVKQLMHLRDAQLIFYNENTQRKMQHVVDGGTDTYQIAINQSQVRAIEKSLKESKYIPDTLTLNLWDYNETAEFYYNEESCELVIESLNHFDIIDGYHRYLAMSNVYNLENNFDYSIELRIVNFTEGKAQQFIWQEDQKTKMKKIDSESYNQYNGGNQVITRLNSDANCNLMGLMGRSGNVVDVGIFSQMINSTFFYNAKDSEKKKLVVEVSKSLKDVINNLTEHDSSLLEKQWDNNLVISLICCSYSRVLNIETIIKVYEYLNQQPINYAQRISRETYKKVNKVMEEVINNA